ncbi:MAG TPA: hypothetical protein PK006_05230 [Saprospiraceae bacterium]|nr:hypothetical protein [Saprospiraceae bacterium]
MAEKQENNKRNWLIFIVSTLVTVLLLIYFPAWFWVPLPFVLTYLTMAFGAM